MVMDWLKKKSTVKTKQNYIHAPQAVVKINLLLDQRKPNMPVQRVIH